MRFPLTSGVIVVVLLGKVPVLAAERPSFGCARTTTAAEKMICTNPRLAALGRRDRCRTVTTTVERDDGRMIKKRERICD